MSNEDNTVKWEGITELPCGCTIESQGTIDKNLLPPLRVSIAEPEEK